MNIHDSFTIQKQTEGHYSDVDFNETVKQYDPLPCLRIYCVSWPNQYRMQIRGTGKIHSDGRKDSKIRNLFASINLNVQDLEQLGEYIKLAIKEKQKYEK